MKKINFATTNAYKIQFANNIINKLGYEAVPTEVGLIEPQSLSQEFVAEFKVKQAYEQSSVPIVTMDSGLFINALNGFPGVYTHDIFKQLSTHDIVGLLNNKIDRSAFLQQTVAYYDGEVLKVFTSRANGHVAPIEEIKEGKTYDGFFFSDQFQKTKSEMTQDEMCEMWGSAWNQLIEWLESE